MFGDVQRGGFQGSGSAKIRAVEAFGVWRSLSDACGVLSGESLAEVGFGERGSDSVRMGRVGDE